MATHIADQWILSSTIGILKGNDHASGVVLQVHAVLKRVDIPRIGVSPLTKSKPLHSPKAIQNQAQRLRTDVAMITRALEMVISAKQSAQNHLAYRVA